MARRQKRSAKAQHTNKPDESYRSIVKTNEGINLILNKDFSSPVEVKIIKEKESLCTKIINYLSTFGSVIVVIAAIVTIHEMRLDRSAAYHPDILLNPVSYSFSWDENGFESWLNTEHEVVEVSKPTYNGEEYTGTIGIHWQMLGQSSFSSLPVANIGVGAAKEVVFDWDGGNTKRLDDYLLKLKPEKEDFCDIGSAATVFMYENYMVHVDNEKPYEYMYMLPTAKEDETNSLNIPAIYTLLVHEIMKCEDYSSTDTEPYIVVKISCKDSIGNKVEDKWVVISFVRTYYSQSPNGSGEATYQMIPLYAE
ncbi:MAG: hypothetical protein MJ077_08555 [Oscillospiraceae bacterium]|nr:hypothetical protein [Oscillospiraceae bacterium]